MKTKKTSFMLPENDIMAKGQSTLKKENMPLLEKTLGMIHQRKAASLLLYSKMEFLEKLEEEISELKEKINELDKQITVLSK